MKVLLINPPANSPYPVMPLGLAYLAAVLETHNIQIEVIDAWAEGFAIETIGKEVAKRDPQVVGITMLTAIYEMAMKTVNVVRQNSDAQIIVGGPHPSALPEQCLQQNPNIDFCVIGEGERTLVELVGALSKKHSDFSNIKGLAYQNNNKVVNTGYADYIKNLDELPFPARHLFPLRKYKTHLPYGRKNPYMTLITSRGCPYRCTYCSKAVFGNKYRAASPYMVVDEIKHIVEEYGVREIHFYDDDLTINMRRAEAICDEIIRQKIRVDWSCTTRVDHVDENLIRKMKRAGCWLISYGVESGNADVLKMAKKGCTLEQVREAFKLTKKFKIRTLGFFMFGLPGETDETTRETIDFSLELDPDLASWAVVTLLPGSKLYDTTIKSGEGYNLKSTNIIRGPHLYSTGGDYAIYEGAMTKERLLDYSNKAHKIFYLRPKYLIRMLLKIRSLSELFSYIKIGLKFILIMIKNRQK